PPGDETAGAAGGGAHGSARLRRPACVDAGGRATAAIRRSQIRHRRGGNREPAHGVPPARSQAAHRQRSLALADARRARQAEPGARRGAEVNRGSFYKTIFNNQLGISAQIWRKLPVAAFTDLHVALLTDRSVELMW